MAKYSHHVFVCGNRRPDGHPRGCCDPQGENSLRDLLKAEIRRQGLHASVRVNSAGCLDQCELGPVIVIYPQAIWYGGVTLEDVPRIVEATIRRGEVLSDLLIADEMVNTKGRGPTCDMQNVAGQDAAPEREESSIQDGGAAQGGQDACKS